MNMFKIVLGWTVVMIGIAAISPVGATSAVPEVDPATGVSALAVLAGGLVILQSRRRS
jgi:hypothetical protein